MDTLPIPYKNVMITYKATICRGVYGMDRSIEIVKRRAFYSNSHGFYNRSDEWVSKPNGFFEVPQYWGMFTFSDGTQALLPKGFYSYGRVDIEEIIKWEYEK